MAAVSATAMAEARLRRKQLLSAEEAELFELAQAAGSGLDPEVFRVLLDLLRMNVAPLAVFQVLKSMCAGQRLPPGPESGPPATPALLPADTRDSCSKETGWFGKNKSNSAVSGTQVLAERSSREGSAQRMPRQPSASRLQKTGASGKNTGGGNST
ncbi:mitotic-spindle organizing protein 2B-like isoform X1 [Neopsephotus bourkii]|uniref:mitotic-spindle organizing protein 2B-like isoform X1 n=1 Tax=Neopsephotus bourkii TaxID=309878 RepID=UPI002AA5742F|nr:mitotic-spindle organizing protein 2B-like isoform X1 [Neopsephotus bourkii]